MNPAKRKLIINLAVLSVLDQCAGYLVPHHTLFQQTSVEVRPTPLLSEFEDCLKGLQQLHFITAVADELGGPAKYKLTDLGKAKLAEAHF